MREVTSRTYRKRARRREQVSKEVEEGKRLERWCYTRCFIWQV